MLEIWELVKKMGDILVVDHVSMKIEQRKIYGLFGPNGAGKTTLMNMIAGEMIPTQGDVLVDGHSIFKEQSRARRRIGYLPENPLSHVEMKVQDYLEYVAKYKKVPFWGRAKQIESAIAASGVKGLEGQEIHTLSKGEQKMVGLAQALLGAPEYVLLDEPMTGLDTKQTSEMRSRIKDLAKKHTMLLSTRNLEEIQEVCDKIYILSEGKVVESDTRENLEQKYAAGNVVEVAALADRSLLYRLVTDCKHVADVRIFEDEDVQGMVRARITLEEGYDIREELFYSCAYASCPLLEIKQVKNNLEEKICEAVEEF